VLVNLFEVCLAHLLCFIFGLARAKEMITQDVKDEKKAIDMYKEMIGLVQKENDTTTAFLFMEILKEEEDHHDPFSTLSEQV
jgi:bacterioferritin